jgi:hypothetical protein
VYATHVGSSVRKDCILIRAAGQRDLGDDAEGAQALATSFRLFSLDRKSLVDRFCEQSTDYPSAAYSGVICADKDSSPLDDLATVGVRSAEWSFPEMPT